MHSQLDDIDGERAFVNIEPNDAPRPSDRAIEKSARHSRGGRFALSSCTERKLRDREILLPIDDGLLVLDEKGVSGRDPVCPLGGQSSGAPSLKYPETRTQSWSGSSGCGGQPSAGLGIGIAGFARAGKAPGGIMNAPWGGADHGGAACGGQPII